MASNGSDYFGQRTSTGRPVLTTHVTAPIGPIISAWKNSPAYMGPDDVSATIMYDGALVGTDPGQWRSSARFVPGSTLGGRVGPSKLRDVMIIGSIPRGADDGVVRPIDGLLGAGKDVLIKALEEMGIDPAMWHDFYVTNMVRFPRIDGGKTKTIYSAWVNECTPFLQQELLLTMPKVILCIGTDSSKYFTGFPVTKAHRKFVPPIGPKASRISPQK